MKIILINASPRKNGATAKILSAFVRQLEPRGDVTLSLIHLADLKLAFCEGCCVCYRTGECFIEDGVEQLSQAISEADGLIIGTPCYASNVSGQLKTLIDRGHFIFEQLLKGKHAVGVVTYENAEAVSAYRVLKKLFLFSGARTIDRLIVKIRFNADPNAGKQTRDQVRAKADRLYSSILHQRRYTPLNQIIHYAVLTFGIKPFVLKKGAAYQGVLQHWQKRGISYGSL